MQLPSVTRSLRFRLSGFTSAVVFGLGGLALGAVYLTVLWRLRSTTMTALVVTGEPVRIGGQTHILPEITEQEIRTIESIFREFVLNQVAVVMLVVLFGLFLLSLLISWLITGRALKPVTRITEVAEEIEATDLSRRIGPVGSDDELTRLGATFDSMLDRLDKAFQSQKRFLAQTSHDLRTPLAVIRSNLEVTMEDPRTTIDDWRATADVIERSAESMASMVEGLLAAARLDVEAATFVTTDLGQLVTRTAIDNAARAAGCGVSIDARAEEVTATCEPLGIGRALTNLLDNAMRVAPEGSSVLIASGRHQGCPFVAVADRGPGLSSFTQGDGRNGRRGLGLSIVRGVVDKHRGLVTVVDRVGGGAVVVMMLPDPGESVPPGLPIL